ncbi:carbon-phosphorus lyase complex subunit PhnI [Brucella sp. C7-11G]
MYVPVKGGETAIAESLKALARARRGDLSIPELSVEQIREQMRGAVDRVMTEGGLYDRDIAALALKQAQGDVAEATFLVRAHRATLRRMGHSEPVDFSAVRYDRHISATVKELPGGQILGATYDYTHRLLDFSLMEETPSTAPQDEDWPDSAALPSVDDFLRRQPLLQTQAVEHEVPVDITHTPLRPPYGQSETLGHLVRGEEGFLTGVAYTRLRTAGAAHPYVEELSAGEVEILVELEDIGLTISIGDMDVTACRVVAPVLDGPQSHFSSGFGAAFGVNERKAVAMATIDQALKSGLDPEMVLAHSDGVAASGYVSHLKLPHYSDFQADIDSIRRAKGET